MPSLGGATRVEWAPDPARDNEVRAWVVDDERGVREPVEWAPLPGSQQAFLECPIYECTMGGNRGGGKTAGLLVSYGGHCGPCCSACTPGRGCCGACPEARVLGVRCGRGWGPEWRGIIFRQTYPQLEDLMAKAGVLFPRVFPTARYNKAQYRWEWPTGEVLLLRHMAHPADYDNYHGHAYPFIGFEELTAWPSDECFTRMMSTSRSTARGLPLKVRATCNPYGPGHNWVKRRYRLPVPPGAVVGPVIADARDREGRLEPPRVFIRSDLRENKVLMGNDPMYMQRLLASASNDEQRRAWVEGDWNIVAGGMFDDVWEELLHCLPQVTPGMLKAWLVDRSLDWGQSAPFSVGWWAESRGFPLELPEGPWSQSQPGAVRGDVVRIAEWYGCGYKPNEGLRMPAGEAARGILLREERWGLAGVVRPGPADASIFTDWEPGKSPAGEMLKEGVRWTPSDKRKDSRVKGWQRIRSMLEAAKLTPEQRRAQGVPGLWVCGASCPAFISLIPTLPRDDKNPDDLNTKSEDHLADEVRYRVWSKNLQVEAGSWK